MTTEQLEQALKHLPRKGSINYPLYCSWKKSPWTIELNLHDWAIEHGYLTGALFKKTTRFKTTYKLLLAGPCPWEEGALRWYTATVR